MKGKIELLLERADDNLESIQLLIDNGYHDIAVSRSYYAMFYAAEAVLLTKNLKFSSHSGVVSQFGIHFIKTGIFKPELGRDFNIGMPTRLWPV
ncbi:HEPN domain-containing protein [Methanobacterium formicicum]|uniref:HEPN domain-containing protein n=1 Tax=Methanobacterium formicicum TaxID=2162 RepID=A0A843AZ60_METFO|nr:HEPN domain-containing protein [Methanobacterium formicicum]MBF4475915.1 HEPN domain-containing protein [Methanobacterium formicicum]